MSTSPASSHETIIVSDRQTLLNVNMTNVTKLTSSNFLMWSRQVTALLNGYDLFGYVDGSTVVPQPTLIADDVTTVNPAYSMWKRQDNLIFSALLGAITNTIQPILSTAQTSMEIWSILSDTYAKPSRGHVKQIKQQVKDWTKGTKSIDEYFQGFTTRFDHLALLGKPYDLEDQIEFILGGLPEEYKTVADQIEGRDVPPTLSEVHEKLRNREATLQTSTVSAPSLPITANAVSHRGSHNSGNYRRNNNNNGRSNHTWQQQQQFAPRNQQHTPRGYNGKC